jgi:hypothetical protein
VLTAGAAATANARCDFRACVMGLEGIVSQRIDTP